MERKLPFIAIYGTDFIVDVLRNELREKSNPGNVMRIGKMYYRANNQGYSFNYDINTKNFPTENALFDLGSAKDILEVILPDLVHIDPENMAKRYGLSLEDMNGKSDFELTIIPGSSLDRRWNKGVLPTLDIAGHIFYIDLEKDRLRPKGDFKSRGIHLEEIRDYFDRDRRGYIIPYNPATHEFQQDNISTMTALPEDTITVQFPDMNFMDPIGRCKIGMVGIPKIENQNFDMHFEARTVPWEETNVIEHIKRNVAEQLCPKEEYIQKEHIQDHLYKIPIDLDRILPTIEIHGTTFFVDVNQLELREKENHNNTLSFERMREKPTEGYTFLYSPEKKKLPEPLGKSVKIEIPDFVKLDPVGMAKKYDIPFEKIKHMTDFDLMVDQTGYDRIAHQHALPTLDIAGHLFYVDLRKDRLCPKDDIWSRGIIFSELEHYYSSKDKSYTIPYNTYTRTFQEINIDAKQIPPELIIIQIPDKNILNPILINQELDFNKSFGLKIGGFQHHFVAKVIPWYQTQLAETIQVKNSKISIEQQKSHIPQQEGQEQKHSRTNNFKDRQKSKKGRKM